MGMPPPPRVDIDTVRTNEILEKMPRSMLQEMPREELARLRATVRAMVKNIPWTGSPLLDPFELRSVGYSFSDILRSHSNCACITTPVV